MTPTYDETYAYTLVALACVGLFFAAWVVFYSIFFVCMQCSCANSCPYKCIRCCGACCGGHKKSFYSRQQVQCTICTIFFLYMFVAAGIAMGILGNITFNDALYRLEDTMYAKMASAQELAKEMHSDVLATQWYTHTYQEGQLDDDNGELTPSQSVARHNAAFVDRKFLVFSEFFAEVYKAGLKNQHLVHSSISYRMIANYVYYAFPVTGTLCAIAGLCIKFKCWIKYFVTITLISLLFSWIFFAASLPASKTMFDVCRTSDTLNEAVLNPAAYFAEHSSSSSYSNRMSTTPSSTQTTPYNTSLSASPLNSTSTGMLDYTRDVENNVYLSPEVLAINSTTNGALLPGCLAVAEYNGTWLATSFVTKQLLDTLSQATDHLILNSTELHSPDVNVATPEELSIYMNRVSQELTLLLETDAENPSFTDNTQLQNSISDLETMVFVFNDLIDAINCKYLSDAAYTFSTEFCPDLTRSIVLVCACDIVLGILLFPTTWFVMSRFTQVMVTSSKGEADEDVDAEEKNKLHDENDKQRPKGGDENRPPLDESEVQVELMPDKSFKYDNQTDRPPAYNPYAGGDVGGTSTQRYVYTPAPSAPPDTTGHADQIYMYSHDGHKGGRGSDANNHYYYQ